MSRKSIIAALSIILISVIVVYSLQYLKGRAAGKQNTMDAVPLDAVFVLNSASLHNMVKSFFDGNKVYDQLRKLPKLHVVDTILFEIDTISNDDKRINEVYRHCPISVSAHAVGKDRIGFIYYLNVEEKLSMNDVKSLINEYIDSQANISIRKYEGYAISDILIHDQDESFEWSFATVNNLMILSSSSILLENALRQMKQPNKIYDSEEFQDVEQTIGKNVNGNIFINYNQLPALLGTFFKTKNNSVINAFENFASWAGLDVHIKPEAFMLSGFTHLKDSLNTFLNIFADQTPQRIGLYDIFPASSNTFFVVGVDNFAEYLLKYNDHLNFLGKYSKRKAYIEKIQNQLNFSFYDDFAKFIDNEFGFAVSEFTTIENSTDFPFVVVKAKSGDKIVQGLEKIITNAASNASRSRNSFKKNIRLDEKTTITVYEIPVKNFSYQLLGHFFDFPNNRYATVIDNHLVLGESPQSLAKFVHLKILGKTLTSNPVFMNFSALMSDLTNIFFYSSIPKSIGVFNSFFNDEVISGIRNNNDVFQKVQAFGIQYNVANNRMFTNVFMQYNKQFNQVAHTVWETLLDTALNFKPAFVKNHYTNENEIFVQDLHNNIYLINKVGRVLWKQSLDDQINSEIFQVDFYENGKLQFLFSTPSQIHLIDRNGNYVERYPVPLRSEATAGMVLFDYDNTHDHRIFIPAENKKIYLYNLEGNIVQGWKFEGAEHIVQEPVKHFRVGRKDYIVFSDGLRVYILSRRGNVRVPVNELITKSKNNEIYLNSPGTLPNMVTTNKEGDIIKIFFDGKIERQSIGEYSPEHYFIFEDMNADGQKDFVFMDGKKLEVFGQNGKAIFSRTFVSDITHSPSYYHFTYNDRKIGITSAKENKIYLINNDGNLYKGFPLKGNTSFSIGRLTSTSRFNLIVGNNDNFLLNYSVQ